MARLAFMTFVVLREPWGSPGVAGFEARLERTFAAAAAAPGFVEMDDTEIEDWAMADDDPRWGPSGPYHIRQIYPGDRSPAAPPRDAITLSVRRDLESMFAFAYSGPQLEAFQKRREWIDARRWPAYVAWWTDDDEQPTWADAVDRLDKLHTEGPSASAFDFHHPFDAEGRPPARPTLIGRKPTNAPETGRD